MSGARILVTRAAEQAEATARRLAARGHVSLIAPVTRIVPVPGRLPQGDVLAPGAATALVVTSRNALAAGGGRLRGLLDRPVFAVGERTAAAARAAGFVRVDAGPSDGAALATLIATSMPPGSAVLHLAGRDRRPEPDRSLMAAGFRVAVWELYAAEAVPELPETAAAALAAGGLEAALHYSARTAAITLRLAAEAGLGDAFGALRHVALSGEIGAALGGIPPHRLFVAATPTEDSLFDALEASGGLASPESAM